MPLGKFLVSYKSEKPDEQTAAYEFLLGVTDVTHGKFWCASEGYRPDTVFDALDEWIMKLKAKTKFCTRNCPRKERAAFVITEILGKKYPCQKGKSLAQHSAQGPQGNPLQKQGKDIFAPGLPMKYAIVPKWRQGNEEDSTTFAFLLGVIDATEGKLWCSYDRFKTLTVFEWVFSDMKELAPSRHDERAADVLLGSLLKNFGPRPATRARPRANGLDRLTCDRRA
jgi:hypothetical protein